MKIPAPIAAGDAAKWRGLSPGPNIGASVGHAQHFYLRGQNRRHKLTFCPNDSLGRSAIHVTGQSQRRVGFSRKVATGWEFN